ncbi:hypothetical protein ColLi_13428 [Colletotrichum liriopes]|uniref:Uncharacterized protein n=1 Tax=Colletotrichum liriopes TaxID=708192 RepID=A0AA37H071_9PEZI|nr:hypothetical protein ColLi_13428 [Colletotrichum liriopes]
MAHQTQPANTSLVMWRSSYDTDDAYFDALLAAGKNLDDCDPGLRNSYAQFISSFENNRIYDTTNLSDITHLPESVTQVPLDLVEKKLNQLRDEYERRDRKPARRLPLTLPVSVRVSPLPPPNPSADLALPFLPRTQPIVHNDITNDNDNDDDDENNNNKDMDEETRLMEAIAEETRVFRHHNEAYANATRESTKHQEAMAASTALLIDLNVQHIRLCGRGGIVDGRQPESTTSTFPYVPGGLVPSDSTPFVNNGKALPNTSRDRPWRIPNCPLNHQLRKTGAEERADMCNSNDNNNYNITWGRLDVGCSSIAWEWNAETPSSLALIVHRLHHK